MIVLARWTGVSAMSAYQTIPRNAVASSSFRPRRLATAAQASSVSGPSSSIKGKGKGKERATSSTVREHNDDWETIIGLEIHAQIKTPTKLFSHPLARKGRLSIRAGDNHSRRTFDVRITQLQIEQDTAKSQTVGDNVLVDLNRAGTGLMEIVTEPDMRSAAEAGAFVKKLQALLRRVGSADGDMEKGNLRVDVNVSVHRPRTPFGTRCEIKNINSVRFLQAAIESETRRHIAHYLSNPSLPIKQETRGLNEMTGETFALRSKEEAEDYRYMPDSNLPAMVIEPTYLTSLRETLPEMPWDTVTRLESEYKITKRDAETLLGLDEYHAKGVQYFEAVTGGEKKIGKKAVNWIVHELLGQLGKANIAWNEAIIPASLMRELVLAVEARDITGTTGKAVIKHCIAHAHAHPPSITLSAILNDLGSPPSSSSSSSSTGKGDGGIDVQDLARKAIDNQPKSVADYRKGNENAIMRLVGEIMKLSGGRADARKAKEVLIELLKQ